MPPTECEASVIKGSEVSRLSVAIQKTIFESLHWIEINEARLVFLKEISVMNCHILLNGWASE